MANIEVKVPSAYPEGSNSPIPMAPIPSELGDLSKDLKHSQRRRNVLKLAGATGIAASLAIVASGVRAQEDPDAKTAALIDPDCPPILEVDTSPIPSMSPNPDGSVDVFVPESPTPSLLPEEQTDENLATLSKEVSGEDLAQLDNEALIDNSSDSDVILDSEDILTAEASLAPNANLSEEATTDTLAGETSVVEIDEDLEMPASGKAFLERLKDNTRLKPKATGIKDVRFVINCLLTRHSEELSNYTQYFDPSDTINKADFKEQMDWIKNGYEGDIKAVVDINRAISVADLESSLASAYAQTDNPELKAYLVYSSDVVLNYALTKIGPKNKRNKYKRIIIDFINASLSDWRFQDS